MVKTKKHVTVESFILIGKSGSNLTSRPQLHYTKKNRKSNKNFYIAGSAGLIDPYPSFRVMTHCTSPISVITSSVSGNVMKNSHLPPW
jgi:hypothetical protein